MAKIGRHELSQAVRDSANITAADADRAVAAVVSAMQMALQRGDSVELRGFGSFTTKSKDARMGRNPRTGQPIPIAARRVARFSASPALLR